MTVNEAAKHLEVSQSTVYALCSGGLLAHHRVGAKSRSIRITRSDLDAYVRSGRVEVGGDAPAAETPTRGRGGRPPIPDVFADMRARKAARRAAKASR